MCSTGCLVCRFLTTRQEKCRAVCFPGCFRASRGPTPPSPPPARTLAAPTSVPAQARCLVLSHSPLSLCKQVWFFMVLEPLCCFPHMRCSLFCPCYWCPPHRCFLHPSPWLCLAAQVHIAPNLMRLSPAYTSEARKVSVTVSP